MNSDFATDRRGSQINYCIYHLHSDLSNGIANIDSVTKYTDYIERAKDIQMTALGFSEHGSVFEWYHKKTDIEAAGMKYLHGCEVYVTQTLDEKIRDNMHVVLIARNHNGFLELNRLVSNAFNKKDNHFYYVPRIGLDELLATSDDILVTTACIGGILGKGTEPVQKRFLDFLQRNTQRCFLEIGHHPDATQVAYNKTIAALGKEYGVRLIAGTDTHSLNAEHEKGRTILQKAKIRRFDNEDGWDLRFKTYDELVEAYVAQNALPQDVFLEAIQNTNVLADMVEPFALDKDTKYPHIYKNPEETLYTKIKDAQTNHPYALQNHGREELDRVIEEEFGVFKATGTADFMLLQTYLREWELANGIRCGYGRGSVSGSMAAYLLGITQMDSLRFGLNFFRFMNPARVSNADIDTDYAGKDRETVKRFLLRDKMDIPTIRSSEIITFNTIALKGAIRDVGRALQMELSEVSAICEKCDGDTVPEKIRAKYKTLFSYVDIVKGAIVSIGTHPSGVLLSDLPLEETVGLCAVSSSEYPVSMLNMKELDDLMYVKVDLLGLDNLSVINDTCDILGIDRLTPDNTNLEDDAVWRSIRDDTTLIFQWESNSAQAFIRRFMSDDTLEKARERIPNFSMLKWLSFGNGLIRPACASFRDSVAKGNFYDNGFKELNDFLAMEAGHIAMQETIMQFLVQFCGYSNAESDSVRRAIAKKKGTETLLPEIEKRFIAHTSATYTISAEECERVIKPFIQVILDASAYAFSWNHSDSYSAIGYICGYLRHYHPYEFLTAALNTFSDNTEKTAAITKYAGKRGIQVTMPRWGVSKETYAFDKDAQLISKNLTSVKFISAGAAKELYELARRRQYNHFMDVLTDIENETSVNARQLDILIKIDFFAAFGNQRELLRIADLFYELFKRGQVKQISKEKIEGSPLEAVISKYAVGQTKSGGAAKSYTILDIRSAMREAEEAVKAIGMEDLSDLLKVQNFADVMGYAGYVSGKDEDRRKLYIQEVYPLVRKKDGVQFGYSIVTKSIGSGKESRFTVVNRIFNQNPIKKGEIIYCLQYEKSGQYYRLNAYEKLSA